MAEMVPFNYGEFRHEMDKRRAAAEQSRLEVLEQQVADAWAVLGERQEGSTMTLAEGIVSRLEEAYAAGRFHAQVEQEEYETEQYLNEEPVNPNAIDRKNPARCADFSESCKEEPCPDCELSDG